MIRHRLLGLIAIPLLVAGCSGGSSGDASSTSSTPTTTSATATMTSVTPPATPPTERPVAFRDYLQSIGVTGEPAHFDQAPGLAVTVPVPDGWARTADPLFATGIDFVQPVGDTGNYPTVTLMAIRLVGNFDPKVAIRHANTDALPPTATDVTESYDDYDGFPSAAAQGVAGGAQHYSRIVLVDVPSANQHYLVQLTATTRVDQPIAGSPQLSSVIDGFKVAVT